MKLVIAIGATALALTACNKAEQANMMNEDTAVMADDMAMNGDIDANAMTNDSAEANMVMNDMTQNDADANLANGM